jgi:glycosyltransferase involved in cell wall biosynthesis
VREARTGLSHARNTGVDEAGADYVAFLDDDARAAPAWVEAIRQVIAEEAPDLFGGPHKAWFGGPRPGWFRPEFASWRPGEQRRPLRPDEHVIGMNMVVRRDLLRQLGGFRTDLGMSGATLGYGEDTELQERIRRLRPGARLLYCPRVEVEHRVRPEKMTLRWQLRHCWRRGVQAGTIYGPQAFSPRHSPRVDALVRLAAHGLLGVLSGLGVLLRSRARHPYWQGYVVERVCPHLYAVVAYASFLLSPRRRGEAGR